MTRQITLFLFAKGSIMRHQLNGLTLHLASLALTFSLTSELSAQGLQPLENIVQISPYCGVVFSRSCALLSVVRQQPEMLGAIGNGGLE